MCYSKKLLNEDILQSKCILSTEAIHVETIKKTKTKQKTGFYKLKLVPVDEDEFLVMLSLLFELLFFMCLIRESTNTVASSGSCEILPETFWTLEVLHTVCLYVHQSKDKLHMYLKKYDGKKY